MDKKTIFHSIKLYLLPLIMVIIFYFFYSNYSKNIPLQYWDEYNWVSRSYFFDLIVRNKPNDPLWKYFYGYNQPKLTEYLFGASLYPKYLQYIKNKENTGKDFINYLIDNNFYQVDCNGKFYCEKYYKYRLTNKNFIEWKPTDNGTAKYLLNKLGPNFSKTINTILYLRSINSLILALNVVVIYYLVLISSSSVTSLLISLFYGFNGFLINFGLVATSEALFLLLFNLGLFLLFNIFSKKDTSKLLLLTFTIIAALCIQTKLNGAMLVVVFMLITIYNAIKHHKNITMFKNSLKKLIFIPIGVYLIFIITNPYLYSNPLKNSINQFQFRWDTSLEQSKLFNNDNPLTFKNRVGPIYNKLLIENKGSFFNIAFLYIKNNFFILFLNLLTFTIGLLFFLYNIIKKIKHPSYLIISFFFIIQIITALYLNLNWDRYLVHLVFFFVFIQITGLIFIFRFCMKTLRISLTI